MNVLVTSKSFNSINGEHKKILENFATEIKYMDGPFDSEFINQLPDIYDGIIAGDDVYNNEFFKNRKRLKIISKYGIGLDNIDLLSAKENSIEIKNCSGINSDEVSEYLLGLIITSSRNILQSNNLVQKQRKWIRNNSIGFKKSKIGLIGFGNVGKATYNKIKNLEGIVKFYDPFIEKNGVNDRDKVDSLEELIQFSDILCLTLNLTNKNEGLINFKILKENATPNLIIINVSRGKLVKENEVLKALNKNVINYYITDVLSDEIHPFESPLMQSDKCFITPHLGSKTFDNVIRQATMATKNLINGINQAKR